MHPKEVTGIQVSDAEFEATKNAFERFFISYNLSGYYAQKAMQVKTSASVDEVAALNATIHSVETDLAVRGN